MEAKHTQLLQMWEARTKGVTIDTNNGNVSSLYIRNGINLSVRELITFLQDIEEKMLENV